MKCPKCGYDSVPEKARFCPNCGETFHGKEEPSTQISVKMDVGSVVDGKATGMDIGRVTGDVTIDNTVNQIEAKIVEGDYVDHQTITNNILVLGPDAIERIAVRLAEMQGVDKKTMQNIGRRVVPDNVSRQIREVMAAQKEVEAKGMQLTPVAAYNLGVLAAYRRDYDEALEYLHMATQKDEDYSDAFEVIVWLQQYLAVHDIQMSNLDAASRRLADAREAAMHTDPLDPRALTLRGFNAKTQAQIEEARGEKDEQEKHLSGAARLFEHALRLDPDEVSAQHGLGNVQHALGNIDAAIVAYRSVIKLQPSYTAPHHDLALAYEEKMKADPENAEKWCQEALKAWRETYELTPRDPGFPHDYHIRVILPRIRWLEQQCG